MRIDIITIFPEYFGPPGVWQVGPPGVWQVGPPGGSQAGPPGGSEAGPPGVALTGPLGVSLIGKAVQRGDILVQVHDLRSWTHDVHRTVDDSPFGGGPGMVMKPEPWGEALDAVIGAVAQGSAAQGGTAAPGGSAAQGGTAAQGGSLGATGRTGEAGPPGGTQLIVPTGGTQLIVPTPAGALFTQATAAELASAGHLVFACGRYEGIDDRVAQHARRHMTVRELSIGDYVLAGGEPAVLVMIEAICRLIPGVLGNAESAPDDSFGTGEGPMCGLVEGPAYTRPRTWRDLTVPDVLLSGDHAAIARWRRDQALVRTARNRPDLVARLAGPALDARDRQVLSDAGFAVNGKDVAH
jgi:tRNA (guanine37-N1)-methyltransferase